MMGQETTCLPSQFLKELPDDGIELPKSWSKGQNLSNSIYSGLYRENADYKKNYDRQIASKLINIGNSSVSRNAEIHYDKNILPTPSIETTEPKEINYDRQWSKGTRVMSSCFGHGVITAVSGQDVYVTYTIRFADGEKRIAAKFGTLTKID